MRIGILTFHRARNNGAFLQCYALQEALKKLGHDVSVIDYRQPVIEESNKIFSCKHFFQSVNSLRGFCRYLLKVLLSRLSAIPRWNRLRRKYLNLSSVVSTPNDMLPEFDLYLIGSDQLWNRYCTLDFDPVFFGNFSHKAKSRICGYAISTTVQDLVNMPIEMLQKNCKNFSFLSFREKNVCDYITSISSIPCRIDVDPTLLLNKGEWNKLIVKRIIKDNYILTSFLGWDYKVNEVNRTLLEISEREKCKVVDISCAKDPMEFLSLIKFAEKIYTTSFHATIFSLIFEKDFYAISDTKAISERCRFLLENLDCLDRFVPFSTIEKLNLPLIDYNLIGKKIGELRKRSLVYLQSL